MYAQISLVGRVTHDVELRARATTGEPYMLLGLAVNEGYKDHVHTSFYQCWLEAEEATRASKAGMRKGSLLFVNGQLSVVDVPRKDGGTRTVARISRAHWDYIPTGKKADPAAPAAPAATAAAPAAAPTAAPTAPAAQSQDDDYAIIDLDEGDLPF